MTGCNHLCKQGRRCTCGTISKHRALNIVLMAFIVFLMAYLSPRLDDAAGLIGIGGMIYLPEDDERLAKWDRILYWCLIIFMLFCTVVVCAVGCALFAHRMGWIA
jgi:hypothetical protein